MKKGFRLLTVLALSGAMFCWLHLAEADATVFASLDLLGHPSGGEAEPHTEGVFSIDLTGASAVSGTMLPLSRFATGIKYIPLQAGAEPIGRVRRLIAGDSAFVVWHEDRAAIFDGAGRLPMPFTP